MKYSVTHKSFQNYELKTIYLKHTALVYQFHASLQTNSDNKYSIIGFGC